MSKPFATPVLPTTRQQKARHRAELITLLKKLEAARAKQVNTPMVSDRITSEQVLALIDYKIAECKRGLVYLNGE